MHDVFTVRACLVLHLESLSQDTVPTAIVVTAFSDGVVNDVLATDQALLV